MLGRPYSGGTDIAVSGLTKSFGERAVLSGVDLEVAPGSLTAVLGPSGSGKTTLLRILAGFERADSGSVRIGGRVVEDGHHHERPELRRTGYVPQEGALFPHLDALANIGFGLPRKQRRGDRAKELLELVGLKDEGRLYPHQLSGGQQQRVALARALAVCPEVVLLDEPFSSLDATLRAEVRSDVARALSETGTTAVLVTHDQDEALSMAGRVAVLRDGRVAQYAPPEDLYARPASPAVARFVGDANILEGQARGGSVETALGALVISEASHRLAEGQGAVVLVRPEQIQISTGCDHSAGSPAPAASGRVRSCRFYGHDMLVTVGLGGPGAAGDRRDGADLTVQVRLAGSLPLGTGQTVGLDVLGPVTAWPASA